MVIDVSHNFMSL